MSCNPLHHSGKIAVIEARLVILTGASGAGKTTLARSIQETCPATHEVVFFDSIGVPSSRQREAQYGTGHQPGGAWQRAMTIAWMEEIRAILSAGRSVLFEGQMRIAFIQEALTAAQIPSARIILVDCDDATRQRRLQTGRLQAELADPHMLNWARYLREEGLAAGSEILDTGRVPYSDCLDRLRGHFGIFAGSGVAENSGA